MPFPDPSFLAVYGSLRRRSLAKQGLPVLRNLRFYGHGILRGLLFIQNGYPGVLQQPGLVRVEIYRVLSETVWEILDRYEGYRPSIGCRSLFYRKEVTLLHPEIRASVYILGREIPRGSKRLSCLSSLCDRICAPSAAPWFGLDIERPKERGQRFPYSGIAPMRIRVDTRSVVPTTD